MNPTVRRWRLLLGCAAVTAAGLTGAFTALPTVAADPLVPAPSPFSPSAQPASAPVTAPLPAGTWPTVPWPAVPEPTQSATTAGAVEATAPANALVPAASGTLRDYFAANKVAMVPQQAAGFTALHITLPMPAGWTHVPDPNVPDAFAVIADRHSTALYTPNAQMVVYRLDGQFDPQDAITHGFVDSRSLLAWQTTNSSLAPFNGFPSAIIEGTYRDGDLTLNTSRRHVIVPTDDAAYLVSLNVTTCTGRVVGSGPATDGIVSGFRVDRPTQPGATG